MKRLHLFLIVLFAVTLLSPTLYAAKKNDEIAKQYYNQGVSAYNEKDYKTALVRFDEALKLDPSLKASVLLYTGRIAIQDKQWTIAANKIYSAKKLGLSEKQQQQANIALAYIAAYGEPPKRSVPKSEKPFDAYFSTNVEWVENLALPTNVSNTVTPVRKNDSRTNISFGVGKTFETKQNDTITVGYDFSQSLYHKFDTFDLQRHTASGIYTHEVNDKLSMSVNTDFTYYNLDQKDFMHLFSIGPSVFFHEKGPFFGKVGYNYGNLNYKQNSGLDSHVHTINIAQYYFVPNSEDFISVGYVHSEADATLKQWDYEMDGIYVTGKHHFSEKTDIVGSVSYSSYGYHGLDTVQTTKKREDNVVSYAIAYIYKLSEMTDLFVRYSYVDNDSNLRRQAYSSNALSIGMTLYW